MISYNRQFHSTGCSTRSMAFVCSLKVSFILSPFTQTFSGIIPVFKFFSRPRFWGCFFSVELPAFRVQQLSSNSLAESKKRVQDIISIINHPRIQYGILTDGALLN
ncbi:hypothetical protein PGT21_033894 [Puccinia graminis f. sp. tritici]|uniref:Uncharacterized protein n=1 Tax=Puccinia graminis f. sp. tritici TaxID=56615 RepID=A0A5B0QK96_PUCGR|nr:hypothetical protein PGT21_033894 [Puccinia graminis f. sp. tritici]